MKIYGIVFAMGVATGVVQEFEFGMNWADYSRFVGNVFGSLLAAEGVFAFFLEGGFLGLMLFGGNRLGPRLWLFSIFMVVFGAHFSALWILMANSLDADAGGLHHRPGPGPGAGGHDRFLGGRLHALLHPAPPPRLGRLVDRRLGAHAQRQRLVPAAAAPRRPGHLEPAPGAAVLHPLRLTNLFIFGPNQAIEVTNEQPLKLASMEGLWESTSCAPMYLRGLGRRGEPDDDRPLHPVPAELPGLPGHQRHRRGHRLVRARATPPINLVFQAYHLMIDLGSAARRRRGAGRALVRSGSGASSARASSSGCCVLTVFVAEVAITAGWWTAEIGRQPWVVYEVLTTADGLSPTLGGVDVAVSLGGFIGLYALLFLLFLYLMNRKIQAGPEPLEDVETVAVDVAAGHVPGGLPQAALRGRAGADGGEQRQRSGQGRARRGDAMSLADVWFVLFILIIAGYLILDGFDMGVGILHLPLARTDMERRTMLNSIGPIWDGNEVWLVLGGGVLFACFPLVYASLFSGFYLAMMLVLVVLILRAVAIEFRSKEPSPRWRTGWDVVFAARPRWAWPSSSAWPSGTSCEVCRSTQTATSPSRSSTCSRRSRSLSVSRRWPCSPCTGRSTCA